MELAAFAVIVLLMLVAIIVDGPHRNSEPAEYRILQIEGDFYMNQIIGIAPGGTGTFAANPIDANGNPITTPLTIVPVWTASDPNATVSPSADGLTASVSIAGVATPTGNTSLTVANPDGSGANTVSVPYTVVSPPPPANVPAGFGISQTS